MIKNHYKPDLTAQVQSTDNVHMVNGNGIENTCKVLKDKLSIYKKNLKSNKLFVKLFLLFGFNIFRCVSKIVNYKE